MPIPLRISGNSGTRAFYYILSENNVTLRGLIIGGNGPGGPVNGSGGAIFNFANLTLIECTISENSVVNGSGGAIYNSGNLVLTKCTLSGNSASILGGAIHNHKSATLTQCTLSGNSAGDGISSGWGGAIANTMGTLNLTHCTLSSNMASKGGGIYVENFTPPPKITNCIVAKNAANTGRDISSASTFARAGVNLIGDRGGSGFLSGLPNGSGDYVGTGLNPLNPQLGPLGNYGGRTLTMPLLPSSIARNRAAVLAAITDDQRGYPIVGTPDVGAYEAGTLNNFTTWSLETVGTSFNFDGDRDQDGQLDGVEYATRTDPVAATANPLAASMQIAGPTIQLSFPYRAEAKDLRYMVYRSADLITWAEIYRYDAETGSVAEIGVVAEENPSTQIITLIDSTPSPANFWRMQVERLP